MPTKSDTEIEIDNFHKDVTKSAGEVVMALIRKRVTRRTLQDAIARCRGACDRLENYIQQNF